MVYTHHISLHRLAVDITVLRYDYFIRYFGGTYNNFQFQSTSLALARSNVTSQFSHISSKYESNSNDFFQAIVDGTSELVVDQSSIVGVGSYRGVRQAETRTQKIVFRRTASGGTYGHDNFKPGTSIYL